MSADSAPFSLVTRSKLQLASGSGVRDNGSLHRWVLLKNSIFRTLPAPTPLAAADVVPTDDDEEPDAFVFPDVNDAPVVLEEQQWFDALLETLDEDEDVDVGCCCEPAPVSLLPALPDSDDDEDADELDDLSPPPSPLASTADLRAVAPFCPPPLLGADYPVPYPPLPLLVDVPRPRAFYADADVDADLDDLPVPDAIADDSDADDDSDALSTPSLMRSSASANNLNMNLNLRRPGPQQLRVVDPDDVDADAYFFDGLPFPYADDAHHHHTLYSSQEC